MEAVGFVEFLAALLAKTDGRRLLVTHQVNIPALTGQGTSSGEVLVIRPEGEGYEVIGRILIRP